MINKYFRFQADIKLEAILRNATELCKLFPAEFVKCCLTCDNFKETEEICMKFKMKPPARVIAFSCGENYENINDEIPF